MAIKIVVVTIIITIVIIMHDIIHMLYSPSCTAGDVPKSNWLISRGKASHVLNCEDGGGDVGDFRHFPVIITVIIIHTF